MTVEWLATLAAIIVTFSRKLDQVQEQDRKPQVQDMGGTT